MIQWKLTYFWYFVFFTRLYASKWLSFFFNKKRKSNTGMWYKLYRDGKMTLMGKIKSNSWMRRVEVATFTTNVFLNPLQFSLIVKDWPICISMLWIEGNMDIINMTFRSEEFILIVLYHILHLYCHICMQLCLLHHDKPCVHVHVVEIMIEAMRKKDNSVFLYTF